MIAEYVLEDCGAKALITSAAMRSLLSELDLSAISIRVCVDGELNGFDTTPQHGFR